jgi:hypothetical protein
VVFGWVAPRFREPVQRALHYARRCAVPTWQLARCLRLARAGWSAGQASRDVLLDHVEGVPVYIAALQFEAWRHTQLLIDVVPGRGSGFSLEAPLGVLFLTRPRVFDEAERRWLDACPPGRGEVSPARSGRRGE